MEIFFITFIFLIVIITLMSLGVMLMGKNIKGSWGGSSKPDKDVKVIADLYNQGFMPLEKLITKTYSLEEINLALDDLKNSNVFRPLIVF